MKNRETILAKSDGTGLSEHCKQVCRKVIELNEKEGVDEKLKPICAIAGLFHDIGKCTSDFQSHLLDPEHKRRHYHQIVSVRIMRSYVKINFPDEYGGWEDMYQKCIEKAIMQHHPTDFSRLTEEERSPLVSSVEELFPEDCGRIKETVAELVDYYNRDVAERFERKVTLTFVDRDNCTQIQEEYYTSSTNLKSGNAILPIVHGSLIAADQFVSASLNSDEYIDSQSRCPSGFKLSESYDRERFAKQSETADQLDGRVNVLTADTGWGKTTVAVLWSLKSSKKVIWVAPNNAVAMAAYRGIVRTLDDIGEHERTKRVGLLLTNEFVVGEELGCRNDIIVTNIDNFTRPMFVSDSKKYMLFNMNYCDVVLDEYHDYFTKSGSLLAAFKNVMRSRGKYIRNSRTLLMSATDETLMYDEFSGDDFLRRVYVSDDRYRAKKKYRIKFSDGKATKGGLGNRDLLVVRNSVRSAQKEYQSAGGDVCIHGDFTKNGKKEKLESIIKAHGKEGDRNQLVVSTNFITTGSDISFSRIIMTPTYLDEAIQYLGRVNRWGEDETGYVEVCDVLDRSEKFAIKVKYDTTLQKYEYDFLKKRLQGKSETTMDEIYAIRKELNSLKEYRNLKSDTFKKWMAKSFGELSKMKYRRSASDDGGEWTHIQSRGIRGVGDLSVFIHAKGMADGEYINHTFETDDDMMAVLNNNVYMLGRLEKDKGMMKEYGLDKWVVKWAKGNLDERQKIKLSKILLSLAKSSRTPFIADPRDFIYSNEIGLVKK